jgi:hypothetical protein
LVQYFEKLGIQELTWRSLAEELLLHAGAIECRENVTIILPDYPAMAGLTINPKNARPAGLQNRPPRNVLCCCSFQHNIETGCFLGSRYVLTES